MGKIYSIPGASPSMSRDRHEPDRIFWGRFENVCNMLALAYPDMKATRRGDTWTVDAPCMAAMEAFEELAIMHNNRIKVPGKLSRADHVQYFLRTFVAMSKTGGDAFNAILKNPDING